MNIILYTIGCPKCKILESKLKSKSINFTMVSDEKILEEKGFDLLPVLEVDGKIMNFSDAVKWVNLK